MENKTFCFVIGTPNRTYFISATSGQEMYDWVMALRSARAELCAENPNGKRLADVNVRAEKRKKKREKNFFAEISFSLDQRNRSKTFGRRHQD
jgi:hypothetical protein